MNDDDIYISQEKIIADLEEEIKRLKKELNETAELLLYPKIKTEIVQNSSWDCYVVTKLKMPISAYTLYAKEWVPEELTNNKEFIEHITLNNTKQIAIDYFERGLIYWMAKEQNEEERIFENE